MGMPEGSALLSPVKARHWSARAAEVVLAARAAEVDRLSERVVLVPFRLEGALPHRYRLVAKKEAGEHILLECSGVRALLVVSIQEIRALPDRSVVADLSIAYYGATCDRPKREVVQEGIDSYRVIFGRGRPVVLFQSSLAL